jgi:ATP-dependent RNA helicase DDX55/SPB4
VLVGTPGRLDDVLTRSGALSLRRLELLVLDEADRLLSMGFAPQVNAIIRRLPKQRRTGLFSATQTEEVQELARAGLRNPMRITVRDTATGGGGGSAPSKTPSKLRLLYATCPDAAAKLPLLVSFLSRYGATQKVLVYFLTCACVDHFAHALPLLAPELGGTNGASAGCITALHGRMEQAKRQRALEAFASASHGVLLATDVAARGLDIPGVDWVVQFDPPQDPDAFVHRCGRTARMGAHGSAVVFLLPHEDSYVEFLSRRGVTVTAAPAADMRHDADGAEEADEQQEGAAQRMCDMLRAKCETEREFMDRGVRAFVSFVRGYQEHSCRFIFRVRELDLGALALALGLLRLPRMPETKHLRQRRGDDSDGGAGFVQSPVDPETVPYKDKTREKQRQQRLAQQAADAPAKPGRAQQRKDAAAAAHAAPAAPPHRLPAQKRRQVQQRADDDDLDADWRMLKKLKAGKVSEHEYNVACGLSSDDEEEEAPGERHKAGKQHAGSGHNIKQRPGGKQQQRR